VECVGTQALRTLPRGLRNECGYGAGLRSIYGTKTLEVRVLFFLDDEAAWQFGTRVCTGIARFARSRDFGLQFRPYIPRTRPDEIGVSTEPKRGYRSAARNSSIDG
jgi:hypothetical protein